MRIAHRQATCENGEAIAIHVNSALATKLQHTADLGLTAKNARRSTIQESGLGIKTEAGLRVQKPTKHADEQKLRILLDPRGVITNGAVAAQDHLVDASDNLTTSRIPPLSPRNPPPISQHQHIRIADEAALAALELGTCRRESSALGDASIQGMSTRTHSSPWLTCLSHLVKIFVNELLVMVAGVSLHVFERDPAYRPGMRRWHRESAAALDQREFPPSRRVSFDKLHTVMSVKYVMSNTA
ncbi:hypothetical protein JHW43_006521 [Diplocarpon mali]|nr:hypothetical protein JHW43_006521 [Diplocarpon mali]